MKVILLCGKARSGKGTASNILKEKLENNGHKVCEIQVMRTVKGYVKDYFNWDGNEDTKPRKLLQELGYDIIRVKLNKPNFHLDRLSEDIEILSNMFDIFIVNDIRLPEEITYLKNKFSTISIGISIKDYISPLNTNEEAHITEHALDNYNNYDYEIISENVDDLSKKLEDILNKEMI